MIYDSSSFNIGNLIRLSVRLGGIGPQMKDREDRVLMCLAFSFPTTAPPGLGEVVLEYTELAVATMAYVVVSDFVQGNFTCSLYANQLPR